MMRGRFITLEGGEGAGKSTQARFIADTLRAQGRTVVLTREPGGSPLAEAIRGVVLAGWDEGVPPTAEALLIFAARAAHLSATVRPALAAGQDVICDRFVDASHAYQGAGRGLPGERVQQLEDWVLDGLTPDLTLLFDLPVETGLARAKGRGDANRFEAETRAFHERVRQCYRARAVAGGARYAVIDAGRPLDQVQAAVHTALMARWPVAPA